jgi:hypothetical protein
MVKCEKKHYPMIQMVNRLSTLIQWPLISFMIGNGNYFMYIKSEKA